MKIKKNKKKTDKTKKKKQKIRKIVFFHVAVCFSASRYIPVCILQRGKAVYRYVDYTPIVFLSNLISSHPILIFFFLLQYIQFS